MPTNFNLRASNNATFQWTRDLTQFASLYNIAAATIRMQVRTSPYAPDPPAYQWLSTALAGGQIVFNATSNLCAFVAPEADMARMQGDYVYDCRLEFSGGATIVIFGGRIRFSRGVTRTPTDAAATDVSGLGDTVSVEGETGTSPVPLPLSLSSLLVVCENAASSASAAASSAASSAASVTPEELATQMAAQPATSLAALAEALIAALPPSALAAAISEMIPTLPTAPVSGGATLWSNSGLLERS
ncbi:hypothetical protein [Rhodoblastus sp.]|uniref:hypothetical protein n=1 Tax=Rhodoblastus sp. TaxID=1962975 RepID=UPI003F9460BB